MNWDKALKPEKVRKLVYEIFADGPPREHKKLSVFKGDTFVKKKKEIHLSEMFGIGRGLALGHK